MINLNKKIIFFLSLVILSNLVSACSGSRNACDKLQEILPSIGTTLRMVVASPGSQYNNYLAEDIQKLRNLSGDTQVMSAIDKLVMNLENLMTSLNGSNTGKAEFYVNEMTTSVQLLTVACNN